MLWIIGYSGSGFFFWFIFGFFMLACWFFWMGYLLGFFFCCLFGGFEMWFCFVLFCKYSTLGMKYWTIFACEDQNPSVPNLRWMFWWSVIYFSLQHLQTLQYLIKEDQHAQERPLPSLGSLLCMMQLCPGRGGNLHLASKFFSSASNNIFLIFRCFSSDLFIWRL